MNKKRIVEITIDEFNEIVSKLKKDKYTIHKNEDVKIPLNRNAFIIDKVVFVELTYKDIDTLETCTYKASKTGSFGMVHKITGMNSYSTLQHYFKIPHVSDKENAKFSASPLLYFNEKFNNSRIENCIGYDINSSYSYGMIQPMPKDTDKGPIDKFRIVKDDEIGFMVDGELSLPGEYADFIFKSEESPFKRFVEVWYSRKKNATGQKKQDAKDILNMAIGFLQRHNFWYRAAILGYCNRRIINLIDKYKDDILVCNTDSVISTRPIPEIEADIGNELGQWKLEHKGSFAYKNMNYQWDYNIPTYRGINKKWFPENFDIINDPIPQMNNIYHLCDDFKIRRNVDEEI